VEPAQLEQMVARTATPASSAIDISSEMLKSARPRYRNPGLIPASPAARRCDKGCRAYRSQRKASRVLMCYSLFMISGLAAPRSSPRRRLEVGGILSIV